MPRHKRRIQKKGGSVLKKIISVLLALLLALTVPALAAEAGEAGTEHVLVACIDTGASAQAIGTAAVSAGKNYVFENRDCSDRIGHGTAVAGLILSASGSENVGVVPLVCYDRYPSGVSKRADVQTISQAIRDAVDVFSCRVINLSMGVTEDAPELREAVEYAETCGAVVVSAVGNSNATASELSYYPAAYPTVIGVGAADGAAPAAFSQRRGVSVLAQGTDVEVLSIKNGHDTESVSGSSYACAAVSGICAALLEAYPEKTPGELRALLFSGAVDLGAPGFDADSGWGLVRTAAEKARQPFLDVAPSAWYSDAVKAVYAGGLMGGVGNGMFVPGESITRAQMASVIMRYVQKLDGDASLTGVLQYSDVPADAWYAPAAAWAAKAGLIFGYPDGRFGGADTLTRQQCVAVLYRCAQLLGVDTAAAETMDAFEDTEQLSDYALEPMRWAVERGIISGIGEGRLAPAQGMTRAQFCAALSRWISVVEA